jgi:hypothetical protein
VFQMSFAVRKRIATLLACVLAFSYTALNGQGTNPESGQNGFDFLGPGNVVFWNDSDSKFRLWRMALGSAATWTALSLPPSLRELKAKNGDDSVTVTVQDGVVRLFWVDDKKCFEGGGTNHCPSEIVQAESHDGGNTWESFASPVDDLDGSGQMSEVSQVIMTDKSHGWMLLDGGIGAGQLPGALATTDDGGKTWKKAAAEDMPIGSDGSELLIPRSATEAWFAFSSAGQNEGPIDVSHTTDGGRTWHDVVHPFAAGFPWCKDCFRLGMTSGDDLYNRLHKERVCLYVNLEIEHGAINRSGGWARYCLSPHSKAWSGPVRVPTMPKISRTKTDANGKDVLRLSGDAQPKLMYSSDHGVHWTQLIVPAGGPL